MAGTTTACLTRDADACERSAEPARRGRSRAGRLLFTLLALALVSLGIFSASASARLAGGPLAGAHPFLSPPKVTKAPTSVTVEEGQTATFESTASGSPTVQWQLSTDNGTTWNPIAGATSTTYAIASTLTSESGDEFRAVFTNAAGSATSKAATLTVTKLPSITQQPQSTTAEEGHTATFEATASGFPAPTVQWEISTNGGTSYKKISGATSTVLSLANVKDAETGTKVEAIFSNAAGEAISEAATLTVVTAPKVTKNPSNQTVDAGQFAIFEASATGFPGPAVQWEVSTDAGTTWNPIPEATFNQLAIGGTKPSMNGNLYRARFTNAAGSITSAAAKLTVQTIATVTEEPQNAIVLVGATATFESSANGFPTPTVQWEVSGRRRFDLESDLRREQRHADHRGRPALRKRARVPRGLHQPGGHRPQLAGAPDGLRQRLQGLRLGRQQQGTGRDQLGRTLDFLADADQPPLLRDGALHRSAQRPRPAGRRDGLLVGLQRPRPARR